jgi:hypothetical protein
MVIRRHSEGCPAQIGCPTQIGCSAQTGCPAHLSCSAQPGCPAQNTPAALASSNPVQHVCSPPLPPLLPIPPFCFTSISYLQFPPPPITQASSPRLHHYMESSVLGTPAVRAARSAEFCPNGGPGGGSPLPPPPGSFFTTFSQFSHRKLHRWWFRGEFKSPKPPYLSGTLSSADSNRGWMMRTLVTQSELENAQPEDHRLSAGRIAQCLEEKRTTCSAACQPTGVPTVSKSTKYNVYRRGVSGPVLGFHQGDCNSYLRIAV